MLRTSLDAAEKRLGKKLSPSFRRAYEDGVDTSDPNALSLFHPTMFCESNGGVAVGTRGEELLVLRGEALFVGSEMVASTLAELLATESSGYDGTHVVDVVCPYCGENDAITIDTSGGRTQTFIEDCATCCHPRVVYLEQGAVRIERA